MLILILWSLGGCFLFSCYQYFTIFILLSSLVALWTTYLLAYKFDNYLSYCSSNDRAERHDFWSRVLLYILLFFSPLFLGGKNKRGSRKGGWIAKLVVKSHAFLLEMLKVTPNHIYDSQCDKILNFRYEI